MHQMKPMIHPLLIAMLVAAVLAFSTGCSQNKIEELSTQLDDAHTNLERTQARLAEAKKSQEVAEHEMNADPSPHNPKPGNS